MAAASYHLWFKPAGTVHELLTRTIQKLARTYDAPVFEPHVTLLGHLPRPEGSHLRRAEQLAESLNPVRLTLTEPAIGNEYFQCVFMRVSQTPEVMNANSLARQLFESEQQTYMPHLSLIYGRYPEARKAEIVASVPPNVATSFDATSLVLIRADSDRPTDWFEVAVLPILSVRESQPRPST